jgi:hypothetical protein
MPALQGVMVGGIILAKNQTSGLFMGFLREGRLNAQSAILERQMDILLLSIHAFYTAKSRYFYYRHKNYMLFCSKNSFTLS